MRNICPFAGQVASGMDKVGQVGVKTFRKVKSVDVVELPTEIDDLVDVLYGNVPEFYFGKESVRKRSVL